MIFAFIQEKRSEFIKASSAMHEANQEIERRKTLSVLGKPVGALASEDTQEPSDESCSVRKIFTAKFQGDEASRYMYIHCRHYGAGW